MLFDDFYLQPCPLADFYLQLCLSLMRSFVFACENSRASLSSEHLDLDLPVKTPLLISICSSASLSSEHFDLPVKTRGHFDLPVVPLR
ncbi:hypothetical protein AMTR_s00036p00197450 [Amborella trichopoda]|uniref:Uncharacterized protein n=1 Tax=Amborella trichopoda TaxID=13333 RepID=U5D4V9_AMBTC|nr:hypothetical protein AMTR_s00036p00197450 [Amborella trichopoda]